MHHYNTSPIPDLKPCMLAHAYGDSLLLPYEFMPKKKALARFLCFGMKQSFLFGKGITSDDTDHLLLTGVALCQTRDSEAFAKKLGSYLKGWLLTLPPGIGLATLKSCLKLLVGVHPSKSGVFSAGNGPMMRVPILATYFSDNINLRHEYIKASTLITHSDPKALDCAIALGDFIAYITRTKAKPSLPMLMQILDPVLQYFEFSFFNDKVIPDRTKLVNLMKCSKGVSGYSIHTLAFVIQIVMTTSSPEELITAIIEGAGDTDTIGAIAMSCASALYELDYAKIEKDLILFPVNTGHLRSLDLGLRANFPIAEQAVS